VVFDLALSGLRLEAGARVEPLLVRGWWWGPECDLETLGRLPGGLSEHAGEDGWYRIVRRSEGGARCDGGRVEAGREGPYPTVRLDDTIPTVVVVHALTGDMRAGGPGGWWEPVIGPGRALDPQRVRILCFNNLGSCYGTSGPGDVSFPTRVDDSRFPVPRPGGKGAFPVPEHLLPATVTTWDMARMILLALDALGVGNVHLACGGSLGGMVVLCLAALASRRFERLATFGATWCASPWQIGWNHLGRRAILTDPGFPRDVGPGLELARAIGHMTYRAPEGLEARQERRMADDAADREAAQGGWSSRRAYAVETYLCHQGRKLRQRFDALSYLVQIGAMDHHDLARAPGPPEGHESWISAEHYGPEAIRSSTLAVGIDSDVLFPPAAMESLASRLRENGVEAEYEILRSPHGHDAFLIEWDQVGSLLERALRLRPLGERGGHGRG